MNETRATIKNAIKTLRESNGLNQTEMANILGVKRDAYASWETGRSSPKSEMIVRISRVFNVSCNYILTGERENMWRLACEPNYNKDVYGDQFVSQLTSYEKQILLRLRILNKEDKMKVSKLLTELIPNIDD